MASTAEKIIKRKNKEESSAKEAKINTDPLAGLICFLEKSREISEADSQKGLISRLEKNPQLITTCLNRVSHPGSKPNILSDINWLHWAVYRGYANVVVDLLQRPEHTKLLEAPDFYSKTPLCAAIASGNLTIFKQLLQMH